MLKKTCERNNLQHKLSSKKRKLNIKNIGKIDQGQSRSLARLIKSAFSFVQNELNGFCSLISARSLLNNLLTVS